MTSQHLYLIDASGYIFRAYHALPPLTRASDGTPVGAVSGYCNMLWRLLEELKGPDRPTHLACIFDRSEETFRKELYPAYKANRPPPPEDLAPQFPLVRDATRAFNVPVIELAGFEADDLIATYARVAARDGFKVTIVSSDKDLMQLVDDRIELYDPMKLKPLGREAVFEKFGVAPEKVIEVQALMGDSVDNVPGAKGIGQKTAAELIQQFGDIETLLARTAEIKQPKRREILEASADAIRVSKLLVTLKDDIDLPEPMASLEVRDAEAVSVLSFLELMEFRTLTRRIREQMEREGESVPQTSRPVPTATASTTLEVSRDFNRDGYECVLSLERLEEWIAKARDIGVVAFDTETDRLHPRAHVVGVSLAVAPNEACYIPLRHVFDLASGATPERQIEPAKAFAALKPLLEDPSVLKVAQNAKYDIGVLSREGIRVGPVDDTMLISYTLAAGLHGSGMDELAERHFGYTPLSFKEVTGSGKSQVSFERVPLDVATRYAAEDADVTLRLWMLLKPQLSQAGLRALYESSERPLPLVVSDMEQDGILVDRQFLSRLSGEFAQRMGAQEADAMRLAGHPFNLGSPKQIGDILFGEMGLPGGEKTKTGAWSTGADTLEMLAAQGHELPRVLLDWRQLSKLKGTYTDALAEAIDVETGRVHTSFSIAATSTGRFSSSDPNLQNIPIRTEEGRRIREAFVAAPGKLLIAADYSQIELRLLAHIADIPELKQAFLDGIDIHALTASEMFGVPIKGMDPMIRRQAKAINFGIIYGISAFGLANNLGIPQGEAAAYIKTYFERFPGIRAYMDKTKAEAKENGFVMTAFGRRCWVAGIKSKTPAERAFAERQAINAPIQGSAADVIRRAMTRIPRALEAAALTTKMLLQVHDELVFEAPESEVDRAITLVRSIMENAHLPAVSLTVPLTVEAKAGKSWASAH
jgi:DNA polymerase I